MNTTEHGVRFTCGGQSLIGVLHRPAHGAVRGVLIVTGGPQYRAGSHRQFVLLGRHLAQSGIAAMRFDYRGMGDSEGDARTFDHVDEDLQAALRAFFDAVPTLREIVLWGLCDGATAAALYAPQDARIAGLVLLNPWVRTEAGLARATLRHYYLARLVSPDFWRKLAAGAVDRRGALAAVRRAAKAALSMPRIEAASGIATAGNAGDLPTRLHRALTRFPGPVLIMLSGADLGAREFGALVARHAHWRRLMARSRITRAAIAGANHTCARKVWRDQVADLTTGWISSW